MSKNEQKMSLTAIKEMLASIDGIDGETDDRIKQLEQDPRKGVAKLLKAWEKRLEKNRLLEEKFQTMMLLEKKYWSSGHRYIAGVDEVGRGPLAGPVVAAAVVLPQDFHLLEVNDSKQLTGAKRDELYDKIKESALAIGVGIKSHQVIDQVNIYEATKLAMLDAIDQLDTKPDYLLLDAMKLPTATPQDSIIKGDAKSISIAAASIVAKVTRDRMMEEYDQRYPGYDFANNAGYGTKAHLAGLESLGACPIHRHSFAPVKNLT